MTRSRTSERKRLREREQRRRRLVMLAVAVTTLIVLAVVFWFFANQPAEAPIAEGAVERFPTELESRTTEGYPRFGQANAPLQVAWYCAFDSLDCAAFHDDAIDQLAEWARDGEIVLTYVPLFGQAGNTRGAARAAVCAAQQQSAWPLISTFYGWREAYGEVQAFNNNRITSGINQLEAMDSGEFGACMRGGNPDTALVEASNDQRGLTGFIGVPAVTLNNVVMVDDEGVQLTTAGGVLAALENVIGGRGVVPTAEATAEAEAEATEAPTATEAASEPEATVEAEATAEATPE